MADTDEVWTAEEVPNYLRIPQSTIYKARPRQCIARFQGGKTLAISPGNNP